VRHGKMGGGRGGGGGEDGRFGVQLLRGGGGAGGGAGPGTPFYTDAGNFLINIPSTRGGHYRKGGGPLPAVGGGGKLPYVGPPRGGLADSVRGPIYQKGGGPTRGTKSRARGGTPGFPEFRGSIMGRKNKKKKQKKKPFLSFTDNVWFQRGGTTGTRWAGYENPFFLAFVLRGKNLATAMSGYKVAVQVGCFTVQGDSFLGVL